MAILEQGLDVILKAIAWITTSNASQYAYDAFTAVANFILKLVGNIAG